MERKRKVAILFSYRSFFAGHPLVSPHIGNDPARCWISTSTLIRPAVFRVIACDQGRAASTVHAIGPAAPRSHAQQDVTKAAAECCTITSSSAFDLP
jgi:hypothetical protein